MRRHLFKELQSPQGLALDTVLPKPHGIGTLLLRIEYSLLLSGGASNNFTRLNLNRPNLTLLFSIEAGSNAPLKVPKMCISPPLSEVTDCDRGRPHKYSQHLPQINPGPINANHPHTFTSAKPASQVDFHQTHQKQIQIRRSHYPPPHYP